MFHIRSAELNPLSLWRLELPLKTDLVIWVPMSEAQKDLYKMIIDDNIVSKAVIKTTEKH
jgi:hypothetical protein